MADNTTLNAGTGGDVIATDDIAGVKYQRVKVNFGADGVASDVSSTNPLPVAELVTGTHFAPGYDLAEGAAAAGPLLRDPAGNLVTRSQILTDEGGYRVNFANASLAVSIGTCTFTNGSSAVTGTGFLAADIRTGDYVKLNADAESAWVQVETLNSDTSITLVANYAGTGGSGASSRALIKPVTGTGATISVASGAATIAAGTTAAVFSELERDVDWLPVVKQAGVTISQRIANQTTYIGFYDESSPSAPKWYAWFAADGTTNTSIRCESARNPTTAPSGNEIETTTVTLPNGATTAVSNRYRVEVLGDRVAFYINSTLVATHFKAMPGPGDLLTSTIRVTNGTTPATSTNVVIDYDTVVNHNKLQVGLLSDTEQVIASAVPLQQYSYTFTGVIAINTDLIVLDCLQLRSLFIQCTAMGTAGVVTVQWANDAAFTAPITATLLSEAGATSTTFNAAVMRVTNVMARYCRLRLTTATTALTTTINVWGSQSVYTPIVTTQPVSGTVTANIGTGALAAGTNAIGDVGMQIRANATGAATVSKFTAAATTNAANIKASAGRVVGWHLTNLATSARYFRFFNLATAPTMGTSSPYFVLPIAPSATVQCQLPMGIAFATGIAIACTTAVADLDATATAANDVIGSIWYA